MTFTRTQVREAWLHAWVTSGKPDDAYSTMSRVVLGHWPSDVEDLTEMFRSAFVSGQQTREKV